MTEANCIKASTMQHRQVHLSMPLLPEPWNTRNLALLPTAVMETLSSFGTTIHMKLCTATAPGYLSVPGKRYSEEQKSPLLAAPAIQPAITVTLKSGRMGTG